jgi:hypothetical protein
VEKFTEKFDFPSEILCRADELEEKFGSRDSENGL